MTRRDVLFGIGVHKILECHLKGSIENYKSLKSINGNMKDSLIKKVDAFLINKCLKLIDVECLIKYKDVTGKIDALFKTTEGKLVIIDWKTTKRIRFSPINGLKVKRSNMSKYQINVYRYILEKKYGKGVEMYICFICGRIDPKITFQRVEYIDDQIIERILDFKERKLKFL
jgi:hypothetical protein